MHTDCGERKMNKQAKFQLILSGVLFALFILLLILVLTVDVRPVAPDGSDVGLSTLNEAVAKAIGISDGWKKLTDVLLIVAISEAMVFACIGIVQGVKRKGLKEIDYSLIALAITYLAIMFLYIFFELVVINRRPVLEDGKAEASFPSTHTLVILTIVGTGITEINYLVKNKTIKICSDVVSYVIMLLAVVGRLLAGVHWLTDILAGILLSQTIVAAYNGASVILNGKNASGSEIETVSPEVTDAVN